MSNPMDFNASNESDSMNAANSELLDEMEVSYENYEFESFSCEKSICDQIIECKPNHLSRKFNISNGVNEIESLERGDLNEINTNNKFTDFKEFHKLSNQLFENQELDSQIDGYEDEVSSENKNMSNIAKKTSPVAGLSDSQPFLSASAQELTASFEDEKSVALTTEMASALAPPDMPLILAPTILTSSTQPCVSIPNLSTLKYSPTKQLPDQGIISDNSWMLKSEIDIRLEKQRKKRQSVTEVSNDAEKVKESKSKNRMQEIESDITHLTKDNIPVDYDEPEFVWEDYLRETGSQAAPPESFCHVEASIKNGFQKDQVIEIKYGRNEENYWLARIVTVCGRFLGMQYITDDNCDASKEDDDDDENLLTSQRMKCDIWRVAQDGDRCMYSLGWCKDNQKSLVPPAECASRIKCIDELVAKVMQTCTTPYQYLFEKNFGISPSLVFFKGMLLELQEEMSPNHIWPVRVQKNVGGQLLLKYFGASDEENLIWIFYLDYKVHPVGWCEERKSDGYVYKPPVFIEILHPELIRALYPAASASFIKDLEAKKNQATLKACASEAKKYCLPPDTFKGQIEIHNHLFRQGVKLEALHPKLKCAICPATVIKVINQKYFIVEIDDVSEGIGDEEKLRMCCHRDSPNIFPARWCVRSGLRLLPPKGMKYDFEWKEYLARTSADPAPERAFNLKIQKHQFERGMKLEALDPDEPQQICAATIIRIVEHLMWIHLESSTKLVYNHVVDVRSMRIFPIRWCEGNDYQLKPPRKISAKRKLSSALLSEKQMTAEEYRSAAYNKLIKEEGNHWCPKIFFNHRCFSGAFLSKVRLASLPKSIGPGPMSLVMKEVLTMLINGAYKSSRVLRELQLEGSPNPSMNQHILKAKCKGKNYKATVEICKSTDQLEEFCRQVCIKLECCPLLFSPMWIEGECPENCSQLTKSKYTACYGKKGNKLKKGRPPGGQSNLENVYKPGKGRKRKRGRKPTNKRNSDSDGNGADNESVNESLGSSSKLDEEVEDILSNQPIPKKRKYEKKVLPPTDIKTRGIKLPNFGAPISEKRSRMPSAKIRELLSYDQPLPAEKKPRGRPGRPKLNKDVPKTQPAQAQVTQPSDGIAGFQGETEVRLMSNPWFWTVDQVADYIKNTDSAQFASILKDQEIDGQALLMLSLPTVQEYLDYKLGPALKLCQHVERLKTAFYHQFVMSR